MRRLALILALAVPLASGPALAQDAQVQSGPFDPAADAAMALNDAFATLAVDWAASGQAQDPGRRVLAIFGANWCHDSRDLVAMLAHPRIARLIAQSYQVVLIDAGTPQTGNGHNLDLAAQYGVRDITGTPTVLVLGVDGELLNTPDNARSWRNASTRSEDEVYRFLRQWTKAKR